LEILATTKKSKVKKANEWGWHFDALQGL
jgi:hypothetical protein